MPVLDHTKPHQKYFETICSIPHPSMNEKAVSDYVVSVAKSFNLEYVQDNWGNVMVRKPATPGYESSPTVILQAHMDMVCVKTPDSSHNFDTDPLQIYVNEQGHIRANGTTLGADDGYGVSYLLSAMEEDFPHPELELVFTVQEENGCYGIDALDCDWLKGRRMIGLDVMGQNIEYTCCVSCFNSNLVVIKKNCEIEKISIVSPKATDSESSNPESTDSKIFNPDSSESKAANPDSSASKVINPDPSESEAIKSESSNFSQPAHSLYTMTLSGIQPIHGGPMVHPEQANAIKAAARLLESLLLAGVEYNLVSWTGGEAENYAPVTSTFTIAVNPEKVSLKDMETILNREVKLLADELEDGQQALKLDIRSENAIALNSISQADTKALVDLVYLMPSSYFSLDPATGEMTATNNIGVIELADGNFTLTMSDRCKTAHHQKNLEQRIRLLSDYAKAECEITLRYKPWDYNPKSVLLGETAKLMKDMYGHEMIENICPGGLECCSMIPRMPGLDVVMFAPIGGFCHTTEEWLNLASFDRVYEFLKELLKRLK